MRGGGGWMKVGGRLGWGWMGDVTVPNRLMHLYRNETIYYSMRCVWVVGVVVFVCACVCVSEGGGGLDG